MGTIASSLIQPPVGIVRQEKLALGLLPSPSAQTLLPSLIQIPGPSEGSSHISKGTDRFVGFGVCFQIIGKPFPILRLKPSAPVSKLRLLNLNAEASRSCCSLGEPQWATHQSLPKLFIMPPHFLSCGKRDPSHTVAPVRHEFHPGWGTPGPRA